MPNKFCNPRPENRAKVWSLLKNSVTTIFVVQRTDPPIKNGVIDIVILNAGAVGLEFDLIEGIHNLQVINHFSNFLFLNLIFDLLNTKDGNVPRVVAVGSEAYHWFGNGDLKFWQKYESMEEAKKALPKGIVKQTLQGRQLYIIDHFTG